MFLRLLKLFAIQNAMIRLSITVLKNMGSLSNIIILLAAGVLIVPLAERIKLGAIPGFLIAGVIIGPSVLGLISPNETIHHLSEFGVVFLLFVIGMELNPRQLWGMRHWVFGLGSLQIIYCGLAIGAILYWGLAFLGNPISTNAAIILGPTLALSSTAFVMPMLISKRALSKPYGQASFSILLMQDLAVVPLLALLSFLATPDADPGIEMLWAILEGFAILALVIVASRLFLQSALNHIAASNNSEMFTATTLLLVISMAAITEHIGLSMEMGAFLAGLLVADCRYKHQIMAEIHPFRGILLGLFFISMGLTLQLSVLVEKPLIIALGVITLLAVNFSLIYPLARLFKLDNFQALSTAFLLSQSGEFALVIFASALNNQLISSGLYQILVMTVFCTLVLTPLLAKIALELANKQNVEHAELPHGEHDNIILAGFGRVGERIGSMLSELNLQYIAVDSDVSIVKRASEDGLPVFYGDVRKPDIFRSLDITNDSTIIITINDFHAAEELVALLKAKVPRANVLVRGHNAKQCQNLIAMGADETVSENLQASLELTRLAFEYNGISADDYRETIRSFKSRYYEDIQQPE